MPRLTITEALQEIKTITARVEKKRSALAPYIARDSRVRDPFESSGGSGKHIRAERQSIADLETRLIRIRTSIQTANLSNTLAIGDTARSVAEWLTWRREIADKQKAFLASLAATVQKVRNEVQKKGGKITAMASAQVDLTDGAPAEVVVSLDEKEVLTDLDTLENILGTLDGKLSLFNAITEIEA